MTGKRGLIVGVARRRGWKARVARVLVVAAVLGALVVAVGHRPILRGNFGVVDPGRVYRSAQPRSDLRRTVASYRLGSILNLRGGSEADAWYAAEVRAASDLGVDFYDLPLCATQRPSRRELLVLLDLFGRCRYPLLIHCKSGADRTGLASALYLMAVRGVAPRAALGAFSVLHGHFPIGGPEHLHEPFAEYDAWLRDRRLPHAPDRLRWWVEHAYRADDAPGAVPPLEPGPRLGLSSAAASSKRD
ncbi:MAG TPA: tyrosine-protein phosphatase [Isosphaeraceae bacterium]